MKVLIVSQYFWPESFIINEISSKLAEAGHKVTVLTGKPNYPDGNYFKGYKFFGVDHETYNQVDIIRVPIISRGNSNRIRLALNYISFVVSGSLLFPSLIFKLKFDVIFVYAPSPITSTIPAILLKFIRRKKLCLWVQDLWPESLQATGHVNNKFIISATEVLVKFIYKSCDKLLIQSEAFKKPMTKYVDIRKIFYYPNTVDIAPYKEIKPLELDNEKRLERSIQKNFSIVFAGNIGIAQAIDTIIDAAVILATKKSEIKFFLIGSGSRLNWANKRINETALTNVYLPGRYPQDTMPALLSKADVLLVSLTNKKIFSYTVPYRIQTYLAVGKPIVASVNGEGARIVEVEARAGVCCNAENAEELAYAILKIFNMSEIERKNMGDNGRRYFSEHFDMDPLLGRLEKILLP